MLSEKYVDCFVGESVKSRRLALGKSQQEVASRIGVSFQQLQKYESGQNRIGASRLFQLAQVLGVSVAWFFFGLPETASNQKELRQSSHEKFSEEIVQIQQLISSIEDGELRAKLIDLLNQLSKLQGG